MKGWSVRSIILAAIATALLVSAAQADVTVIAPGVTGNSGLPEVAAAFTKKTGIKVIRKGGGMASMIKDVETATPAADIFFLPMELSGRIALDGFVKGPLIPLARVDIGLFKKPEAPMPDISTVPKLIAVLKAASAVLYSDPKSGSMQANMSGELLARPDLAAAGIKGQPVNGDAEPALKAGQGDAHALGLGLIHGVHSPDNKPTDNPYLVGELPAELLMHIDAIAGVSNRGTGDPKDVQAFMDYLQSPEAVAIWKARGSYRFQTK